MTWYQPTPDSHAHRGMVHRGQVSTACNATFVMTFRSRRLDDDPPDHQVCPRCDLSPQERHDRAALVAVRAGDITKQGDRYVHRLVALRAASPMDAALLRLAAGGKVTAENQRGVVAVRTTDAGDARYELLDQRLRNAAAAGFQP
ncbi:MAG: hypothetical protein ACRDTA_13980 [Pseudonocardiaceae bacterium]